MVNSKDFGGRLQKLMDYYGLSASAFADSMSVGRSSISHILSGRNKPSLDFVMKIEEAFPEVELHWLLYGQGTFPNSKNDTTPEKDIPSTQSPSTLPDTSVVQEEEKDLFSLPISETKITTDEDSPISKSTTPIPSRITNDNEIDRIVIFYADGTFHSYQIKKS
ncbi:helix-turn-helix domain-containing protein [Aquimarina sp. 2201CG5-10]|uniref:helix-turn-helix domain-containing protein n=1 Tax=Aquimarina callyspongiae TaxID=3098150 RepID=UPI002AB3D244|nr:helix-turn-helix domain-containing protein [Aquimarina sp. 2201CG5-10]MDY8135649.1 helix-turn-helix domain-containing protein [Aquimarina sp. 2201CG5-10]